MRISLSVTPKEDYTMVNLSGKLSTKCSKRLAVAIHGYWLGNCKKPILIDAISIDGHPSKINDYIIVQKLDELKEKETMKIGILDHSAHRRHNEAIEMFAALKGIKARFFYKDVVEIEDWIYN